MPVIAYHGDETLKEKFVTEMKWHREQDMILQGSTGEGEGPRWKGCCIACGVHSMAKIDGKEYESYDHELWETLIGIPEWMAYFCEAVFEGLPEKEAKEFPVQFSEAVKCGMDINLLKPSLFIFILESVRENAMEDGKAAIDQVISLWRRVDAGEEVSDEEWSAANAAARSAAESAANAANAAANAAAESAANAANAAANAAAESAANAAAESAWSAAWSAAESTAWSTAESAAWSATWSATWSAARSAARSAAWAKFRDELLRLVSGVTK